MARYGKTLRKEDKGRDAWSFLHFMYRPLQLDGDTPRDRLRLLVVYVLLGIALILLISGHWIVALLLFVSVIVVWAVSGPSGPFYEDGDWRRYGISGQTVRLRERCPVSLSS